VPLLNTPCCHYHEFNLAGSFSSKNLTPIKQIKRFHWAGGASRDQELEARNLRSGFQGSRIRVLFYQFNKWHEAFVFILEPSQKQPEIFQVLKLKNLISQNQPALTLWAMR